MFCIIQGSLALLKLHKMANLLGIIALQLIFVRKWTNISFLFEHRISLFIANYRLLSVISDIGHHQTQAIHSLDVRNIRTPEKKIFAAADDQQLETITALFFRNESAINNRLAHRQKLKCNLICDFCRYILTGASTLKIIRLTVNFCFVC